jgi:hypothetical protein
MFEINTLRSFPLTLFAAGLMGMPGRFYQHHLSPTRDSLAPARSALRAFAAAANS